MAGKPHQSDDDTKDRCRDDGKYRHAKRVQDTRGKSLQNRVGRGEGDQRLANVEPGGTVQKIKAAPDVARSKVLAHVPRKERQSRKERKRERALQRPFLQAPCGFAPPVGCVARNNGGGLG